MVAEKGVKRGAYKEADQHEKAYQVQKGVFMFGKTASRKEGSNRAKHVRERRAARKGGGREGGCWGGDTQPRDMSVAQLDSDIGISTH